MNFTGYMKIRKTLKKSVAPLLSIMGAILLVFTLFYITLGSENVRVVTEFRTDNVSYVLVNEDLGATFNGVKYNLGSEFVTVISQDNANRWQTASRTVAEAGLNSGAFDVMIILPQNFSQRLLSLESFTPEAAQITYEVRLGYNELANMAVRSQVMEVLDDFNARVVQMYFSSILGSVFDAQLNVGAMINDEQNRHSLFVDDVRSPFNILPNIFSDVVNNTLFLETETNHWREQHTEFNEIADELLTLIVENFIKHLTDLDEYVDLLRIMGEINLQNISFALEYQSNFDEEFYHEQFSFLNEIILDELLFFNDPNCVNYEDCNSPLLNRFFNRAREFYEHQTYLLRRLEEETEFVETQGTNLVEDWLQQLEEIEEISVELMLVRNNIAELFFSDPELTPEEVELSHIREALINLMGGRQNNDDDDKKYYDEENDEKCDVEYDYDENYCEEDDDSEDEDKKPQLNEIYIEILLEKISNIATDEMLEVVTKMYELQIISYEKLGDLLTQLNLIARFAYEEDIKQAQIDLSLLTPPEETTQQITHTITLPIQTETVNIFELSSNADINITNISAVANGIQTQLTNQLQTGQTAQVGYNQENNQLIVTISTVNNEIIPHTSWTNSTIYTTPQPLNYEYHTEDDVENDTQDNLNHPNNDTNITYTAPPQITPQTTLLTTINVQLTWSINHGENAQNTPVNTTVNWLNCTGNTTCIPNNILFTIPQTNTQILEESNIAIINDLEIILNQINLISSATNQIIMLFAAPTHYDQTPNYFYKTLDEETTIRAQAPIDSIYQLLSNEGRKLTIVDALSYLFFAHGTRLFEDITKHYDQLAYILYATQIEWETSELDELIDQLDDADLLLTEAENFDDWHDIALTNIEITYESWHESHVQFLEKIHHKGEFDPEILNKTIYYDRGINDYLLHNSMMFVFDAQSTSNLLFGRNALMADLGRDFANIVSQTSDMHGLTDSIANDMINLANWTDTSVAQNLAFSDNFIGVMNNARIGGADNPDVLNFLASPITTTGTYEAHGEISFLPYILTIISTVLSIAVGYGLRYYCKKRKMSIIDELAGRSIIWYNLPFTIKAIIASVIISFIFSIISLQFINVQTNIWLTYVTFLLTIPILIITYLARQLPKTTLFIVGAIIAIYLLLNPVLGVQIERGTIVSFIFITSPLNILERVFTQLTTGTIGIINFIILIPVVVLSVAINLFVVDKVTELPTGGEEEDD